MPRTARRALGGVVYHVLNRGNGRRRLFHSPGDYADFVALLRRAKDAVPGIEVLAYCLMPNHWHLVLRPRRAGDLSRFVQRLLTGHVRRHHPRHPAAAGHLYQGGNGGREPNLESTAAAPSASARLIQKARRARAGRSTRCGYDLRGVPGR
jgi:REP element-mobilizing transposase RayT